MFRWENDGLEGFFLVYKQCAWGILRRLYVRDVFASSVPGVKRIAWQNVGGMRLYLDGR